MTTGIRSCDACRAALAPDDVFCPVCGRLSRPEVHIPCEHHPDTAAAAVCVVCGRPVCGRCAHAVQGATVCDRPDHDTVHAQWRVVEEVADPFAADLLVRNLSLNGIPAQAFDHKAFAARTGLDERSRVRVYVHAEHLAAATALLDRLEIRMNNGTSLPEHASKKGH